jgi:hypothetical protein
VEYLTDLRRADGRSCLLPTGSGGLLLQPFAHRFRAVACLRGRVPGEPRKDGPANDRGSARSPAIATSVPWTLGRVGDIPGVRQLAYWASPSSLLPSRQSRRNHRRSPDYAQGAWRAHGFEWRRGAAAVVAFVQAGCCDAHVHNLQRIAGAVDFGLLQGPNLEPEATWSNG